MNSIAVEVGNRKKLYFYAGESLIEFDGYLFCTVHFKCLLASNDTDFSQ